MGASDVGAHGCAPWRRTRGGNRARAARLEPRARLFEILLFLRRAAAAEDRVAVGEAAELLDHVAMQDRVAQDLGIGRAALAAKLDRAVLVVEVFAMLERQIEEKALLLVLEMEIEAAVDGPIGDEARLGVGGERTRRAAKHVARELIEAQQQRQR